MLHLKMGAPWKRRWTEIISTTIFHGSISPLVRLVASLAVHLWPEEHPAASRGSEPQRTFSGGLILERYGCWTKNRGKIPPQIIHFNRVWNHYNINHTFWGTLIFGNIHNLGALGLIFSGVNSVVSFKDFRKLQVTDWVVPPPRLQSSQMKV